MHKTEMSKRRTIRTIWDLFSCLLSCQTVSFVLHTPMRPRQSYFSMPCTFNNVHSRLLMSHADYDEDHHIQVPSFSIPDNSLNCIIIVSASMKLFTIHVLASFVLLCPSYLFNQKIILDELMNTFSSLLNILAGNDRILNDDGEQDDKQTSSSNSNAELSKTI